MVTFTSCKVRSVRLVVLLVGLLTIGGCVVSNGPTIAPTKAEDVGATLEYWSRNGDNPKAELFRFVRRAGTEYQLQLTDRGNPDHPGSPFANGLTFMRISNRGGVPVYLIQFDIARFELDPDITPVELGYNYLSYIVSIDSDGIGTVGTIPCDTKEIVDRANADGVKIVCERSVLGILDFRNLPNADLAPTFLTGLLDEGLIQWEDETGIGALDWIE
jgi:hypothetical protein